ncbi:GDP-mannose 4,6-dehydratase [Alienimonas chondri]|uniref:GDP-mannose 4,6-dehydratase n=1 Tax=Alienimonas chondri TaxID=2681879 RepID=A0ABX1VFF4_9PLAN|nr:GDP-mannose 4,6-dehydratase [Alienimonas chondri]NNJ26602.1 GDP-mannose 4,6-dehydratase [Alienimonas chondri]
MKRALVTGVTGQDGSYLTESLLADGYAVHGLTRDPAGAKASALQGLPGVRPHVDRLTLHAADATDGAAVARLVAEVAPDQIYNLAAQSHIGESFKSPAGTVAANALAVANLLEAARALTDRQEVRFYQASSSELFGSPETAPQNERTPLSPQNPYASAKTCAFHLVRNYRDGYGLFACNGILFNHESPRRPPNYVTRKITLAAARIAAGLQDSVTLGWLGATRDWGFAKEYVEAMRLMLDAETPDDFVIATGVTHTIEDLLAAAFERVGLDWRAHVKTDPAFERPTEVKNLRGDPSKVERVLGWRAETTFEQLVGLMVDADVKRVAAERSAD